MGRYLELLKHHTDPDFDLAQRAPSGEALDLPSHPRLRWPERDTTKTTETTKANPQVHGPLELPVAVKGAPSALGPEPEVAWRVKAMRATIRPGAPIPFLVAREDPTRDGACLSCSLTLGEGERYRCATCLEAAVLVLASLHGPPSVDGSGR
jgi:hypothetical protein